MKYGSYWKMNENYSLQRASREEIKNIPNLKGKDHNCIFLKRGNRYTCPICQAEFIMAPLIMPVNDVPTVGNYKVNP